jgi:hypothetical protein
VIQPIFISPSQMASFRDCPRKWAFDKLDCVPRRETKATAAGTAIHKEVEDYYRHGTVPESREAQALLAHLPPRGPDVEVEVEFSFAWPYTKNVMVHGIIDLVHRPTHRVMDHKTSANLDKALKTPDDLALDAQAAVYGTAYRVMTGHRGDVGLQWTYVQRDAPKRAPPPTIPVVKVQSLTEVEAAFGHWRSTVDELVQIRRRGGKAADVRADTSTCYKYGPCQYRDLCVDFPQNRKPTPELPMDPALAARLRAASTAPLADLPPPRNVEAADAPEPMTRPEGRVIAEPAPMGRIVALAATLGVPPPEPAILPPDAQPNVTPNEPPPPPLVSVAPPKRTRSKKSAGETAAQVQILTPTSNPPYSLQAMMVVGRTTIPEPVDLPDVEPFDLEGFVESVVRRAESSADLTVSLEAARIAVDLLKIRQG